MSDRPRTDFFIPRHLVEKYNALALTNPFTSKTNDRFMLEEALELCTPVAGEVTVEIGKFVKDLKQGKRIQPNIETGSVWMRFINQQHAGVCRTRGQYTSTAVMHLCYKLSLEAGDVPTADEFLPYLSYAYGPPPPTPSLSEIRYAQALAKNGADPRLATANAVMQRLVVARAGGAVYAAGVFARIKQLCHADHGLKQLTARMIAEEAKAANPALFLASPPEAIADYVVSKLDP